MSRDTSSDLPLLEIEYPDRLYHISPVATRESIHAHGLDWRRMGAAPGWASGRNTPEEAATYFAKDVYEVRWFAEVRNHREAVDIWEVQVRGIDLVRTGDGWILTRSVVLPECLVLIETETNPPPDDEDS
jgi:hypothetical protein